MTRGCTCLLCWVDFPENNNQLLLKRARRMNYSNNVLFQFLRFLLEINLFFVIFERPLIALIYVVVVILLQYLNIWIKQIDNSLFQDNIDVASNFIILLQVFAFLTLFAFLKRKLCSIIVAIAVTLIYFKNEHH